MKLIKTEDAVGQMLCHDMTQIIKGEYKDARFRKGHIVTDPEGSLSVSNPIQPKLTAATGTGIGLANLDKRYHLLFRQEIQITEDSNFTVRIPLIRKYP